MSEIELRKIRMEKKATEEHLDNLKEYERKLERELDNMRRLTEEGERLKADAKEGEVNYVLGHSSGYVDGFSSAIATVVEMLTAEYRDIPMTEDELYMLVELGDIRRMAKLKDEKSKNTARKAGWYMDLKGLCATWKKKEVEESDGQKAST